MTTYRDLFDKFSNGHNRLLAAMGQEAFQNQELAKFPLTLSDEDVRNLAAQFGWQEEWNQTKMSKRAKAKAAIALSSDVGQMLSGHLSQGLVKSLLRCLSKVDLVKFIRWFHQFKCHLQFCSHLLQHLLIVFKFPSSPSR